MATSKSDRGHTLAAGREPAAVKARPVELSADMPLAEAFRAVARNCLHHLLANERALLAHGDGEAVHQMRVALRRLRSALKVFRPLVDGPQLNALKEEVRWLLDLLGPARDAEVFLAEIIDPVVKGLPDRTGLSTLRDHWRAERQADLEAARQAVENRRFTLLLLDLGAWVEAGDWSSDAALPGFAHRNDALGPFARGVLDRLARKLHKAGGRHLAALAPPDLHQVRIHGKRLRYAGEFFAPLHAKSEAKAYLGALADLQDRLGEINDIAVAGPRLAGCHHLGDAAWAAGLVTGWHEARRPALIAAADELWTDFRKVRKFWRKG
ncbi:MAG: CHAD domain-containing protein [Magnetospirillum sp.]|nr:CHAD domain-containing protein [Magnetospirillum sp.]